MVTCWLLLRADCRTEVPKHRHVLYVALSISFGHVNMTQCEAVFRNRCFAERIAPQVCNVFLTLNPSHSQPLGSDFILQPQSMCFNLPIPCMWRKCSVAFAALASSRNPDPSTTTQFLSTQTLPMLPHTALPLHCFLQRSLCLRVYAFRVWLPSNITPALDNFRVSSQPAQSESSFHY